MENKKLLFYAVFTALGFGIWPLLVRKSELSQAWVMLFFGIGYIVGSAFLFTCTSGNSLWNRSPTYTTDAVVGMLFLATLINVLATITFTNLMTSPNSNAMLYVAAVMALVPVINKLATPLFEATPPLSWLNKAGLVGVVISIMLLMHKKG